MDYTHSYDYTRIQVQQSCGMNDIAATRSPRRCEGVLVLHGLAGSRLRVKILCK